MLVDIQFNELGKSKLLYDIDYMYITNVSVIVVGKDETVYHFDKSTVLKVGAYNQWI